MKITPIGERVLLKKVKHEERTASGIYIPESASEGKKQGEVVAVGTDKDGKPLPLKKGDKVLYGGYSHEDVEMHDEAYVVVEYKDIVAKIE